MRLLYVIDIYTTLGTCREIKIVTDDIELIKQRITHYKEWKFYKSHELYRQSGRINGKITLDPYTI